ncbi:MAG: divalent-cation tolerance protein CutA [Methanobrevibacter sp.]|jgi:periplasmic divalent cation tolerance protein|nr:divalent-cation tolerance protein CutA [Methanobrevibacter sp.]
MMMALIYITCSNEEESIKIGETLLKERLIACSNIIKEIKSMYWWEGEIAHDEESVLILKTLKNKVDEVIERVKELHSYDNPAILALPIFNVSNSYLEWVKEQLN